jgi:hypothetical protein
VASSIGLASSALPPLTVVNRPQVKVDFQITRCGPSGLGTADVYLSADDGQSWEKTQTDEPLSLPNQGDPSMGSPIQAGVMVKVPRPEVPYGVYLVIKSKAGVGLPPPHRGSMPQMRVEMDTAAPEAKLRLPVPDTTQENVLIFLWEANDRNLDKNPISLEYAESLTGPWRTIGLDLPNTGRHAWRVPNDVPPRVFLKMMARDRAGNCAVVVTKDQVILDTTPPVPTDFHVGP